MLNFPTLPFNKEEPDGTTVTLTPDTYGRWHAKIWEDGLVIDEFYAWRDPIDLLTQIAVAYPHVSFTPHLDGVDTQRQEEINLEKEDP